MTIQDLRFLDIIFLYTHPYMYYSSIKCPKRKLIKRVSCHIVPAEEYSYVNTGGKC